MKKSIFINLENLKLEGNVLDISLKGNNAVSKLLKFQGSETENETTEKDYIKWDSGEIPCPDSQYDIAIAMFSLGKIVNRFKTAKTIRELSRVLKHNGKIIIWDINPRGVMPFTSVDVKAILPDRKILSIPNKIYLNKFSPSFEAVIKILESNNFIVESSRLSSNVYCIEAENIKEAKNEDNSSIT